MPRVRAGAFLLVAFLCWSAPAGAAVDVQRVVSPGGIEAWLVEDRSNPLVSIAVGFRGGSALDPAGKEGLAEMVSGLLNEGAGSLDSQAFQQRLADLAVDFAAEAGRDDFVVTLRTLTDRRDEAFDLLRLALTVPRFDPAPVELVRSQLLALVARRANDPDEVASRVWWQAMFPDHPYGRPPAGTAASLAVIGAEDLRGFVRDRFARDAMVIGVVGDIAAAELAPLLDATFGALPAAAAPAALPEAEPAGGDTIVVERALPQSVVLFGQPGIRRDDPDFYAAAVVNHILGGGGFQSRLTHEIRERRGLAYSVSTWLATYDRAGVILGHVATENPRVAESIALVRAEWRRLAEQGPTPQELEDAKTYLVGSFPLRLTSTLGTARTLVAVQFERLGIDYLDERAALIEAVTLEDAKRVARRLLDAERLLVVVVGAPEGVTPTREPPSGA